MRPLRTVLLALVAVAGSDAPASADATLFIGSATEPSNRGTRGVAIGASFLVVGVEFEYSSTAEAVDDAAPSLRTGTANVYLQTPVTLGGVRPYVIVGAGPYRERLGDASRTNLATSAGGGIKIRLAGPLRVRVDYRRLMLAGNPLYARQHRLYAGLNVGF